MASMRVIIVSPLIVCKLSCAGLAMEPASHPVHVHSSITMPPDIGNDFIAHEGFPCSSAGVMNIAMAETAKIKMAASRFISQVLANIIPVMKGITILSKGALASMVMMECRYRLLCQLSLVQISYDTKACSNSISNPFLTVAPCCLAFFMNRVSSGLYRRS